MPDTQRSTEAIPPTNLKCPVNLTHIWFEGRRRGPGEFPSSIAGLHETLRVKNADSKKKKKKAPPTRTVVHLSFTMHYIFSEPEMFTGKPGGGEL